MDLPPPQIVCIAQVIQAEAGGESDRGKRAVGHVVLNRAKKSGLTPCQVVRQPGQFKMKHTGWKGKAFQIASWLGADPTGGAKYFHSVRVNPRWRYKITTVIGNHVFYK